MRVLLADDHRLLIEGLSSLLNAYGIEVLGIARDGLEAAALAQQLHPDLILMDIRMPVMDGKEATRCLRRLDRSDAVAIPIIALTTDVFEDVRQSIMECGMNAYLDKPVYAEELYTVLLKVWKNV